ncbi:unnamed protein product [Brassica oleracea var. botrytis]
MLLMMSCGLLDFDVGSKIWDDHLLEHLGYVGISSPGPTIIIKPFFTLFKMVPPSSNLTRRLLLIPQSKSVYPSHSTDFGASITRRLISTYNAGVDASMNTHLSSETHFEREESSRLRPLKCQGKQHSLLYSSRQLESRDFAGRRHTTNQTEKTNCR